MGDVIVCLKADEVEHGWRKPKRSEYREFFGKVESGDRLTAAENLMRRCYVGDIEECKALVEEYPAVVGRVTRALERAAGDDLEVEVKKA